jgi:hypothetical protein
MRAALTALVAVLSLQVTRADAQFLAASRKAAETPESFAGRIVQLYAPRGRWWGLQSSAANDAYRARVFSEFYDPAFTKLMNDNGVLASKRLDGPDLDSDPVCQCQDDPGGLRIRSVARRQGGVADVTLAMPCDKGPAKCGDYVIVLRRIAGAWKIYDVVDAQGAVRARLARHNACLSARLSDAALDRCLR